jgi:transposase-like protein
MCKGKVEWLRDASLVLTKKGKLKKIAGWFCGMCCKTFTVEGQ